MSRSPALSLSAAAALAAAALLAPAADAQLRGGLAIGASGYTLTGGQKTEFTPRGALGARMWVEREIRAGIAVGTGVAYLAKGARGTARVGDLFPGESGPDRTLSLRLDAPYIEIPLTVSLDGPTLGPLRTQVYAGPFIGFRQDATLDYAVEGAPFVGRERDASVRPREVGGAGGLTLRMDADAFGDLVAGVHVSGGVTNVRQSEPPLRTLGALVFVGVGF